MSNFKTVLTRDEMAAVVQITVALDIDHPKAKQPEQGARLRARLDEMAGDGESAVCEGTLKRIDLEIYRQLFKAGMQAAATQLIVLGSGRTIAVPARRGLRRKVNGVRERHSQLVLFPELTWEELEELVVFAAKAGEAADARAAGYAEALKLRDKHPNTKTVGEACAAEGIDWRNFALGTGSDS